jgi:hypothetical protein
MLMNLMGTIKIKGRVLKILISGVTCTNQGLLIDITSKHFQSGETIPVREMELDVDHLE